MPLISSFYGVLVYIFKELGGVHKKSHVHAIFGTDKLLVAFDGEILAGSLPRKQQKLVEAWVALNENGEVLKIRGLE